MNIAVYSGSFNPLHIGHVQVMRYLYEHAGFDRVYLIVSPHNPFKDLCLENTARQRFLAAKAAVHANGMEQFVHVDDIEMKMEGPSYTIRTLDALKEREPGNSFTLSTGADILAELPRWREADRILKEYGVVVYPREGFDMKKDREELLSACPEYKIRLLDDAPMLSVSSTQIREMQARGEDCCALEVK